jgi:RNA polymerase sigma factor (sigma-70 family)
MNTELDQADAIARAQHGDRRAFDELYGAHAPALRGFIRPRVAHDQDADDVSQQTWIRVWEKLSTYDPSRASFHTFVRYWAGIMLLRHYDALKRRRGVEALVTELCSRFPDLAKEQDMAAVIERLTRRTIEPPEPDAPVEVYAELLRMTFAGASPPHQLIAFGFSKVSGWTPRKIAAELSDVPLRDLAGRLETAYLEQSKLPAAVLEPGFAPLRAGLGRRFDDAVHDPKTLSTYPHLHERPVGNTTLRDYYTGDDPAANITQWWHAVQRRVRAEVRRQEAGPLFERLREVQGRAARNPSRARMDQGGRDG